MKNFGIKLERTLDFLIGEVKKVESKTFEFKNGIKKLKSHDIIEYSRDGQRTLSVYYDEYGTIRLRQISLFDESGFKIGYENFDDDNIKVGNGTFKNDQKGRITSRYHNGIQEESYEYDTKNNIIQVFYSNTGARDIYDYDQNGFVIKQLSLKGENSMFGNIFGGPNKKLTTFKNDTIGNIGKMEIFDAESKSLLFTQNNAFNDEGDEIESIGSYPDGSIYSHEKYDYAYDRNKNWVNRKTVTPDGLIIREEIRDILYY